MVVLFLFHQFSLLQDIFIPFVIQHRSCTVRKCNKIDGIEVTTSAKKRMKKASTDQVTSR